MEKPPGEFGNAKKTKDGLASWCRACFRDWTIRDKAARPEVYERRRKAGRMRNREADRLNSMRYYQKNRQRAIAYAMEWQRQHRDRARKTINDCNHRLWLNVVNLLGDSCACCGEKRLSMLDVDHRFGDGNKHRRAIGGTRQVYRQILQMLDPRSYFQVLCCNCNHSKRRNRGQCEHTTNQEPKTLFEAEDRFSRFKRRFDFQPFGIAS